MTDQHEVAIVRCYSGVECVVYETSDPAKATLLLTLPEGGQVIYPDRTTGVHPSEVAMNRRGRIIGRTSSLVTGRTAVYVEDDEGYQLESVALREVLKSAVDHAGGHHVGCLHCGATNEDLGDINDNEDGLVSMVIDGETVITEAHKKRCWYYRALELLRTEEES